MARSHFKIEIKAADMASPDIHDFMRRWIDGIRAERNRRKWVDLYCYSMQRDLS